MSETPSRTSRQQESILKSLRRDIIEGRAEPGSRLPARKDLVARFQAGPLTVQRAIDRLEQDGFVRTENRRGSFVVDCPPHLYRFALVFTTHPDFGWTWSDQFLMTALAAAAQEINRTGEVTIELYTGLCELDAAKRVEATLLKEAHAGRLAGVILGHPYAGNLPARLGVPCASFYGKTDLPGILPVLLDRNAWYRQACAYLAEQGCKRVGVIGQSAIELAYIDTVKQIAPQYGLTYSPRWCQGIDARHRPWARHAAMALLGPEDPNDRPDAIFITDDSLIEDTAAGVLETGRSVPEDVLLVGLANFPIHGRDVLPVHRLGWDSRQVLICCLNAIRDHRLGRPLELPVEVPLRSDQNTFTVKTPLFTAASA
ncbi:MAG: GntR family transcriptional regulator [bacterium]